MRPALLALALLAAAPAAAIPVRSPDGELFAFPALLDDRGAPIATSAMRQWFEEGLLHVRIEHALRDGRVAVERATFTQGKELVQRSWSWEERRGGEVVRALAEARDPAVVLETLGTPRSARPQAREPSPRGRR